VFVGVQNAANADVPADKAGLAAALITTSSMLGAALGLATLTGIATNRTAHLLATHAQAPAALTSGFHQALLGCSIFLLVAAGIAIRATTSRSVAIPSSEPAEQRERVSQPA
jgi:hypothetical protein